MAYEPHLKVKPQVIADAAVEALSDQLVVSNTVNREADAKQYWLSAGDTVTMRVKGTVPIRQYDIRNDRTAPIVTDTYSEQKVDVTISQERPYSALKLSDEQKDMDFEGGWGDLIDVQTEAMGQYLETGVLTHILNAPYERTVLIDNSDTAVKAAIARNQDVFFNAVVDAKSSLRKMRAPGTNYTAIVGFALADELIKSNKIVKNQGAGDSALASDTIGTIAGVTFVASPHVADDVAYLYESQAFNVFNSIPSRPNSVPFSATASANGWGLRWLMDYDTGYLTDRTVIDCYSGYSYTKDRLKVLDAQGIQHVADGEFFVRGVKLGLKGGTFGSTEQKPGDGGVDTPGGDANSALAKVFNGQRIDVETPAGEPFPLGGNAFVSAADHEAVVARLDALEGAGA